MSITSNGYLDLLNEKHASKDAYSINAFPYVIESYNDKNTAYYYAPTFINKYIIKDDIYSFDTYKNNGVFQTVTFPEELSSVKINSSNNDVRMLFEFIMPC